MNQNESRTNPQVESWEEELLDLKAVNYNVYFGVGGGDNAVSFDEAVKELNNFIRTLLAEQTKAYGGCTKCYGKGYSTEFYGVRWSSDFGGDFVGGTPKKVQMNYCTCERGEQLKELVAEQTKRARENKTTEGLEKEILSEQEFRENTMGCFYQDELRQHDRAFRKLLATQRKQEREALAEKVRLLEPIMVTTSQEPPFRQDLIGKDQVLSILEG